MDMRKSVLACIILTLLIGLLATACSGTTAPTAPAELIVTQHGEPDPTAATVAQGANEFAFRLSAALLEHGQTENFVVSPYSVWMPLAALTNATMDAYRPALLEALSVAGISPEDINHASSRMLFDLTTTQGKDNDTDPLQIANAIFVDHGFTLRQEFAQTFADFYRGALMNVDFASTAAVDAVNQWASDNTNGLIEEVIQELDPDTVAALVNAIYFSDGWANAFNPDRTEQDVFYTPTGEIYAYFMRQGWDETFYFEDAYIQSVTLPFATGGGMTILLPKDGDAVGLLSGMDSAYFHRIREDSILAQGSLLLPRFSIENTLTNLKGALISLGVPLFDEVAKPLTGGLFDSDIGSWLGDAVQVAMIEVDEEGTTAAAVTVYEIAVDSEPELPPVTFEMVCNTPFAFILHRNTVDGGRQILFTGVVNQPE